jgi:hypothetical protein
MVAAELDAQNEDDLVSILKTFFSLSLPERQNKLERFSLAKPVHLVLKCQNIKEKTLKVLHLGRLRPYWQILE